MDFSNFLTIAVYGVLWIIMVFCNLLLFGL